MSGLTPVATITNIETSGPIDQLIESVTVLVEIKDSFSDDFNVTGGVVDTGIYSASFAYTSSWTSIYPVWHSGAANAIEICNKDHKFKTKIW